MDNLEFDVTTPIREARDVFLSEWGKHLVEDYGLSNEQAEDLELEAAELYAHDTREGWCCACEADIAFAMSSIKDEPEFKTFLTKHTEQAVLEGRVDELGKFGEQLLGHRCKEFQTFCPACEGWKQIDERIATLKTQLEAKE